VDRPSGRPWIIAHRGASASRRENTIAAFAHAALLGADAVEFDVRRSADGQLVVHHDDTVPGVGPIIELAVADLRREAPWVPTFAEAMGACSGMWVNVEIKNSPGDRDWDPTDAALEGAIAALGRSGEAGRVLISSFNPQTVYRALNRLPGLRTGLLIEADADPREAIAAAAASGITAVHPAAASLDDGTVDGVVAAARRHRVGIVTWTVDDAGEIRRLAAAGVDGIITNVVAVARSVLSG
jgi:glycerophosphoryl diester phosphodiesterase